jgi:hypothetical protein
MRQTRSTEPAAARRPSLAALLALLAAGGLAACSPADDEPIGPRDTWTPADHGGDTGTEVATDTGLPPDGCEERARWIYIVSEENMLLRFYPNELRLEEIGTLGCTPTGFGATPFSMSVDRNATAWVLYTGGPINPAGELFRVSTIDASCEPTGFARGQAGFELFGMGFSTDVAGGDAETLYVAGGLASGIATGDQRLGSIDTASLVLTPIATIPGSPELTGTGLAELWGFFPDTSPPMVARIDKTNGRLDRTYNLSISTASTRAWAFAFWGGDFWIFLMAGSDASTNVWKLEADDGSVTEAMHDIGWTIVGAGVSTCAPVVLI